MTACPKCRSTNVHSDRGHKAAHGLHAGIHVSHTMPIAGVLMLATTVLDALFGDRRYHCGNCKNSF